MVGFEFTARGQFVFRRRSGEASLHFSLAERLLYGLPQYVIALAIAALLIAANGMGKWAQRFREERSEKKADSHESFVLSSVMGLLALLMGFTFSMAINSFNDRRALVVEEAASIQSAYLDVQSLPAPYRTRMSNGLINYSDVRIAAATATEPSRAQALLRKSEVIQEALWTTAMAAEQSAPGQPAKSVVRRAENVISVGERRFDSRLPSVPIGIHGVLLIFLTIAATAIGYTYSGAAERVRAVLLVLFTVTLILIVDIEQPTRGFIVESQRPMENVREWMSAHPPAAIERKILSERSLSPTNT